MRTFLRNIVSFLPHNRIVTQFILSHSFLAAASVILVALFLLTAMNSFIMQTVNDNNLEKAKSIKNEIVSFVDNTFNTLSMAAEFDDIFLMEAFMQQNTLYRLQSKYDYYRKLYTIDTMGVIIATSEIGITDSSDVFNRSYELKSGTTQKVSPVYITENEPRLLVSTPILDFDRLIGTLFAEISVSFVWDLVDGLSETIQGGVVYILDNSGKVIAHPERRLVYGNTSFSHLQFVNQLLEGEESVSRYRDPDNNDEVIICAFTPVPELHWGIVVSQPESAALAIFDRILKQLIVMVIASIILASLLAVIITRNLVHPLSSLVRSVKRVEAGNLPSRVKVPRTEELASLAREYNRMTENLSAVQKQLQEAERLATLSKFASVVAHEIRNPFNSIVINMQVLKRGLKKHSDPVNLVKFMDIIESEIRRIDRLIQNYLSFSREPEFNPEPADLNVLIDELIILVHAKAEKQNVRIVSDFDEDSVFIHADISQIKQALLNIILNALEAMPDGGSISIDLKAKHGEPENSGMIKLAFTDDGMGIPGNELSKVFDFFFTSKPTGTGLGLAVTQQIIKKHRGTISIQSKPEIGTEVIVYLQAMKGENKE